MLFVVTYSFWNQFETGFTRKGAGFVSNPFFNDHTIYAASIVFLLPVFLISSIKTWKKNNKPYGIVLFGVFLFFCLAQYFSFCRAAWLSVLISILITTLVFLRIRFYQLTILAVIGLSIIFAFKNSIFKSLKQNKADSYATNAGLGQQIASFGNITNDVSNKERLNRWKCSYRMFQERPFFGFGSGTYLFNYLDFQHPEDMTYISIKKGIRVYYTGFKWSNKPSLKQQFNYAVFMGNGGTAHSEYFLELCENGIFSLISFLCIIIMVIYYAIQTYKSEVKTESKNLILSIAFVLIAYAIHALFNNFLDDCKIAFLFWSSISCLVTLHIRNSSTIKTFTQQ